VGLRFLCWKVKRGLSGWMGRRKWMGMIYQVGSDRQPGRLLRECRWERVLWDGASKNVIADTGLVVVVMWSVVSWICPVPRSVVAARGQIGQSVGA